MPSTRLFPVWGWGSSESSIDVGGIFLVFVILFSPAEAGEVDHLPFSSGSITWES
jgi:hypothetical protein